jgi:hypothetical protein
MYIPMMALMWYIIIDLTRLILSKLRVLRNIRVSYLLG